MYCSERPDGYEDFASVALKNGFLEFRFDTGSGKKKGTDIIKTHFSRGNFSI